jgi:hypothetical protein
MAQASQNDLDGWGIVATTSGTPTPKPAAGSPLTGRRQIGVTVGGARVKEESCVQKISHSIQPFNQPFNGAP